VSGIFARVMGSDFDKLHPQLQRRFGLSVEGGLGCVGRGVMQEVWRGAGWTLPFLHLGAWRHMLIPVQGRDIPFTVENYPYIDRLGRETITFVRTFEVPGPRRARFDATMVHDPTRNVIVDYLGSHQHLATDLSFQAGHDGSLSIRSHEQRFYEGPVGFRFPRLFTGSALLRESYDDQAGRFRIEVNVLNKRFGPLFGYRGTFQCSWVPIGPQGAPASLKPLREEPRLADVGLRRKHR